MAWAVSHSHSLGGQSHTYLLPLLPRPSRWPLCPLVPWLPRAPSDAQSSTASCLSLGRMKITRMTLGCLFQLSLALLSIISHTGKTPFFLGDPPCHAQPHQSPGIRMLGKGFKHLLWIWVSV